MKSEGKVTQGIEKGWGEYRRTHGDLSLTGHLYSSHFSQPEPISSRNLPCINTTSPLLQLKKLRL